MRHTPNPFILFGLVELSDEAERVAGELLARRQRTPDERAALAQRCAFLLIAIGRAVRPGHFVDLAPEFRIESKDPVQAFSAWLARERVATRVLMIRRASEVLLGKSGPLNVAGGTFDSDDEALAAIASMVVKK